MISSRIHHYILVVVLYCAVTAVNNKKDGLSFHMVLLPTATAFTILTYPQQQQLVIKTNSQIRTCKFSKCFVSVNSNLQDAVSLPDSQSKKRSVHSSTSSYTSKHKDVSYPTLQHHHQQQQQKKTIVKVKDIPKLISKKDTPEMLFQHKHTLDRLSHNTGGSVQDDVVIKDEAKDIGGNLEKIIVPIGIVSIVGLAIGLASSMGITGTDIMLGIDQLRTNPQQALQDFVQGVETIGPLAPIVYGLFYFLAELLAVPATPLTMSAGYLFGLVQGFLVVWTAGIAAASITFFIGRTLLRSYVETNILQQNTKLAKIDTAISSGANGFKVILLLRLSPLFPFALSNYVYGASSVDFISYVTATAIGFIPGTLALIFTGMVGKELTLGGVDGTEHPWYLYAIGFGVIVSFLKLITDVASDLINAVADDNDDNDTNNVSI